MRCGTAGSAKIHFRSFEINLQTDRWRLGSAAKLFSAAALDVQLFWRWHIRRVPTPVPPSGRSLCGPIEAPPPPRVFLTGVKDVTGNSPPPGCRSPPLPAPPPS